MDSGRRAFTLGGLFAGALPAGLVLAQDKWPSRPITYIVPFE